jgi:hypothetical protein
MGFIFGSKMGAILGSFFQRPMAERRVFPKSRESRESPESRKPPESLGGLKVVIVVSLAVT